MACKRTSFRNTLTRGLAVMALLCIYGFSGIGASALLVSASTTSALARGGGGHGGGHGGGGFHGFHGGGFRGRGFGYGWGPGFYPYGGYGYGGYWPYYGDIGVCYAVQQRVKTRYGWGTRRVSICE
jgi:hypothetical protein